MQTYLSVLMDPQGNLQKCDEPSLRLESRGVILHMKIKIEKGTRKVVSVEDIVIINRMGFFDVDPMKERRRKSPGLLNGILKSTIFSSSSENSKNLVSVRA